MANNYVTFVPLLGNSVGERPFEAVAFGRTGVLTDPDLARKVLDGVRTAPAGLKLRLDVARPPLPYDAVKNTR